MSQEQTKRFEELCIAAKALTRLGVDDSEILGQVRLALDEAFQETDDEPVNHGNTKVIDPGFSARLDDEQP